MAELRSGIPGYRAVADPRQCNSCRKSLNVCCVMCGADVFISPDAFGFDLPAIAHQALPEDAGALVLVFVGWGSPH